MPGELTGTSGAPGVIISSLQMQQCAGPQMTVTHQGQASTPTAGLRLLYCREYCVMNCAESFLATGPCAPDKPGNKRHTLKSSKCICVKVCVSSHNKRPL